MPTNQDIQTLISGLQIDDPKLWQALSLLNDRLVNVEEDLFPIVRQSEAVITADLAATPPPLFSFAFEPLSVRFNWTAGDNGHQYEIRQGTIWDTASFILRTVSLQADIDPLLVGSYHYLIKAITRSGSYSADATPLDVVVPAIGRFTVTARTIDNNVLLSWGVPTSVFAIARYMVYRETTLLGNSGGNFATYFEMLAGTYNYYVQAIDVAGNLSVREIVTVTLTIPPDYVLESIYTSQLCDTTVTLPFIYIEAPGAAPGSIDFRYDVYPPKASDPTHFYYNFVDITCTLSNVIRVSGPALLACWTAQTWQVHFTSRSWLNPKNQMDAGYPIYIQPSAVNGYFEETVDYGAIFTNLIVTISFTQQNLTADQVSTTVQMSVSTDGVSFTAPTPGASQFFSAIRFLRYRLIFTAPNDKALALISQVTVSLSIKKEMDSGTVSAVKTDVGGTQVNFSKKFKDVDSITLTVEAKEPVTAIYDFVDIPNPVGFKIFALDSTGNRITYDVSWKARGVV
jgi:hypothetical protein